MIFNMDPAEDGKEDAGKENLSEEEQLKEKEQCREFRALFRGAMNAAPKDLFAGNRRNIRREYVKQCVAIAALSQGLSYKELDESIGKLLPQELNSDGKNPLSRRSFFRMKKKMMTTYNPKLRYDVLFGKTGRPRKYEDSVDNEFVKWLKDQQTTNLERLMSSMIEKYTELHITIVGARFAERLSRDGIRRRINELLRQNKFRMRTPKVIEAKRCIRYETTYYWYHDPDVVRILTTVDPAFLFNADETEINRKGGAPGKVACKEGEQPCLVVEDRGGSHVTLFLVISAVGEVMTPTVVLHGPPQEYVKCPHLLPQLKFYETGNGYMTKECFKQIMVECFIPYVNNKRKALDDEIAMLEGKVRDREGTRADVHHLQQLKSVNKRAALIVDGHKSRYFDETFEVLRAADIDLLVLPAHSSHLTQPLDLKLNGLIKDKFKDWYAQRLPGVLDDTVTCRPSPSKRSRSAEGSQAESEDSDGMKVKAEYDRLYVMSAIRNAIPAALTPSNILSAWRTSHLYPFTTDPPYTREKEAEYQNEMVASSGVLVKLNPIELTDGKRTGLVNRRIIGYVNTPEFSSAMIDVLTGDVEPQPCEGSCDYLDCWWGSCDRINRIIYPG